MRYALIFAAVLAAGCARRTSTGPAPLGKDYVLGRPSSWEVVRGHKGVDLMYVSPKSSASDAFRESVGVVLEMVPPVLTEPQYVDAKIEQFKRTYRDFKIEQRSGATVNGRQAYYLKFSYASGRGRTVCEEYIFIRKGAAYVVTCKALGSTFEHYKPQFDTIINTFTLR